MAEEMKFTAKQRQEWHNAMSKKGATKYDSVTGVAKPVSDFERGVHHAKATEILNARKRTKRWYAKQGK